MAIPIEAKPGLVNIAGTKPPEGISSPSSSVAAYCKWQTEHDPGSPYNPVYQNVVEVERAAGLFAELTSSPKP